MWQHEMRRLQLPEGRARTALHAEEPTDMTARQIKLHERFLDTAVAPRVTTNFLWEIILLPHAAAVSEMHLV